MVDRVGQYMGPYQLLRLLGRGSFAEVYLAEHVQRRTQVALKILSANLVGEEVESFGADARAISRLVHPHIAHLLDFGIEEGAPYLVMQYASGGTLRRRLPQHISIPPAALLPFIQQVAGAVQYAHDQHMLHGHIRPENMLLNARAEVLLSDFEMAILEQQRRYQGAQDAGVAAYLAPEQIQGHALPASDQYALGMVAYEWLTGSRPFQGSAREVLNMHLNAAPPPLREKAPHLPQALEEVVLKALEKDPRARFPSVGAFAQAFQAGIEGLTPTTRRTTGPTYGPPEAGGSFRPAMMNPSPSGPLPPAGSGAAQGSPARMRPLLGNNPAGGVPAGSLRPSFPTGSPEFGQQGTPRASPPALRQRLDVAPVPLPRKSSRGRLATLAAVAVVVLVLIGSLGVLGANGGGPLAALFASQGKNAPGGQATGTTGGPVNGRNCSKVGVLMPDTLSSSRWETYDHPLLLQQLEANGFASNEIDYANAGGDAGVQQAQATSDLANGDCILIVAAEDSQAAAAIVSVAKKQQVPVIAYDRLIFSDDLAYYVSFDGVEVGRLQGQYIVDHYKDPEYGVRAGHNHIVFINGSPTDNNATLFAQGAHDVLDPLIQAGTLKNVYEKFTPNWDTTIGKTEMETALADNNDNVQLVLSANDGLGGSVVQALGEQNLAGSVLVTGQDATVAGLQRILEGTQAMTVYKPILKEAQAAAQLAAALRDNKNIASLTHGQTTKNPDGKAAIPSVLETPVAVDRSNMTSTVIADGYVTQDQICTGLPPGTDTSGVCS